MDLISRKSVAKKMLYRRDYVGRPSDPDCIIADEPSVPAVPLDKLCEWLAAHYEPPANVSNGKALDDHEFWVTLWRYVLEKMMEEQDADRE